MVNGGAELGLWLQLKGQQAFRLGFDPANRAFDHRSTDNFPALMWCSSELPHWTRGLHVSFRRSEARGPLTPRSPGVSPDAYGEPQQPRQSHGNKARFGGFPGQRLQCKPTSPKRAAEKTDNGHHRPHPYDTPENPQDGEIQHKII